LPPYENRSAKCPPSTANLYNAIFVERLKGEPQASEEPPLRCYVTESCRRR
jgi:hypothetical protein